ncbi:hypothetical protein BCR44DRAFT_70661, partial [Catenaria anguillulae PL171]
MNQSQKELIEVTQLDRKIPVDIYVQPLLAMSLSIPSSAFPSESSTSETAPGSIRDQVQDAFEQMRAEMVPYAARSGNNDNTTNASTFRAKRLIISSSYLDKQTCGEQAHHAAAHQQLHSRLANLEPHLQGPISVFVHPDSGHGQIAKVCNLTPTMYTFPTGDLNTISAPGADPAATINSACALDPPRTMAMRNAPIILPKYPYDSSTPVPASAVGQGVADMTCALERR